MEKFTFKIIKSTDRWKSFYCCNILLKKKQVGAFYNEGKEGWSIRFMVMKTETITDNNTNSPWMWVTLKHRAESLEAAKDYVNGNFQKITSSFTLNQQDE